MSETTLQQSRLWDMVHNVILVVGVMCRENMRKRIRRIVLGFALQTKYMKDGASALNML